MQGCLLMPSPAPFLAAPTLEDPVAYLSKGEVRRVFYNFTDLQLTKLVQKNFFFFAFPLSGKLGSILKVASGGPHSAMRKRLRDMT